MDNHFDQHKDRYEPGEPGNMVCPVRPPLRGIVIITVSYAEGMKRTLEYEEATGNFKLRSWSSFTLTTTY